MALTVVQAIHQQWADDAVLAALLPATHVYTGLSADATLPYAVISRQNEQPTARMNDGSSVITSTVRVELFAATYDAAAALLEQVKLTFDGSDSGLSGGDQLINMYWVGTTEEQTDDGVWHMLVDLDCTVYQSGEQA